jgi:CSLREA domain-containing protein
MLINRSIYRTPQVLFNLLIILALLLGGAMTATRVRAAAIIEVKSNADTIANDGACTLREAITNANNDNQSGSTDCTAGAGADSIYFDANYTITLVDQLPAVTTAITINGYGEVNTIIQANAVPNTATYRVFEVGAAGNLPSTA